MGLEFQKASFESFFQLCEDEKGECDDHVKTKHLAQLKPHSHKAFFL